MADINKIITPDFAGGGGVTDVNVGNELAAAAAGEGRALAAQIFTSRAEQVASQRKAQAFQKTVGDLTGVVKAAIEVKAKSDAQEALLNATMNADKRIQDLMNTVGIDPLKLSDMADEILLEEKGNAQRAAGSLSREMSNFVTAKMDSMRADRLPQIRREGFKRESAIQVGATNRRNFIRKAEINKDGISDARKAELQEEILDDIWSLAGVHISTDRAEALTEQEVRQQRKDGILKTALTNPELALQTIRKTNFSPTEELNLSNQVRNLMAIDENERKKNEAKATRELKALQEGTFAKIVGAMIGPDKRDGVAIMQDPAVRDNLTGTMMQSITRFNESLVNAQEEASDKASMLPLVRTQAEVSSGLLNPMEVLSRVSSDLESGAAYTKAEAKGLIATGISAWNTKKNESRTDFGIAVTNAQKGINNLLAFTPGMMNIYAPNTKLQLNMAQNQVNALFNARMDEVRRQASDNPNQVFPRIDPQQVANGLLLSALPLVVKTMQGQTVDKQAFTNFFAPNLGEMTSEQVSKTLAQGMEEGKFNSQEAAAMRLGWKLANHASNLAKQQEAQKTADNLIAEANARANR